MTIENELGNPKGLKPLAPGNLEWCNPDVSDERDDEPESEKLNSMESILMYERNTNDSSHAPTKTEPKAKVKKR